MPEKEDFSWDNSKIKNGNTLGKIISIPAQENTNIGMPEKVQSTFEDKKEIVIDEFKEKMAEILSRELHKK
ncbi:hypothetical protein [Methanolobus sp. ZRKC5]|uniref:hypothetical protein n=1 Tax=unclassified Methanolobus TaxID=2629569 RepID=UPI00313D9F2A